MRVYLASNFQSQKRMMKVREALENIGVTVCNGWLEPGVDAQDFEQLSPEQRAMYSYRDIGEIVTVDLLIMDTQEQSTSGGREVEYGMALALGKPVWIVGPTRNIFHTVARRQYDDWEQVVGDLLDEDF